MNIILLESEMLILFRLQCGKFTVIYQPLKCPLSAEGLTGKRCPKSGIFILLPLDVALLY